LKSQRAAAKKKENFHFWLAVESSADIYGGKTLRTLFAAISSAVVTR
jgi:hypothetical protein